MISNHNLCIYSPLDQLERASGGVLFFRGLFVPQEPPRKRTIAFVDGQNLYYAVKNAFGYTFPNYDPSRLAQATKQQITYAPFFTTWLPGLFK